MSFPPLNRPRATIDLAAIAANYRRVLDELAGVPAAGVVKADGYGLGASPVGQTLWDEGCRRFFVARVDEGIELRATLPDAEINVFDGLLPGTESELIENNLVPVLNSLDQIGRWRTAATESGRPLPASIHLDSGMCRLGLPPAEAAVLAAEQTRLDRFEIRLVISHLASADDANSSQSEEQLDFFRRFRTALPLGTASLANSAGVFRGDRFHLGLARPGIALYGGSPFGDLSRPNPMVSAVTVEAPVVQVRSVEPGQTVGYGASYHVDRPGRLATVPVGYADGFLRSASGTGQVAVGGKLVPIVGRVSMDLITIDVTGIEERLIVPGSPVELIGPNCPIDHVAERAGTISYEVLTSLGRRYERRYLA